MRDLKVHVGENVKTFFRNDHREVKPTQTDKSTFVYPAQDGSSEVFHFVYDDPAGSFAVPSARMIWVRQYAGLIYDVTVDTSERKGTIDTVFRELEQLQTTLLQAGWTGKALLPTVGELRQTIASGQGTTTALGAAIFMKDTTTMDLRLSTPGTTVQSGNLDQTAFVAELHIQDPVLKDKAVALCFDARKKERGSEDELLPLQYWLDRQ